MSEQKYEVVKGGSIKIGFGRPIRFNVGEIWDIVSDVMGPQLRKLNQRGGSTCILNGQHVARIGMEVGKLRVIAAEEAMFVAHEELIKRTGARP